MSSVEDFMAKLAKQTAPMTRNAFKEKSNVEKITLAHPSNHGRYAVLPINTAISDYPFVTLFDTREVCIPRKRVLEDGTEEVFNVWVKILPKNGYLMRDKTNRESVTSLTAEDERVLDEAVNLFDALSDEIDLKNDPNRGYGLIRKRNYTIFHAYCLNRWNFDDGRTPTRQNFAGLFICTSKPFMKQVSDNIEETSVLNGGPEWLNDIYTDDLTRRGFMMFSISQNKTRPGFSITVNHKSGIQPVQIPMTEEEYALYRDPVENFLGWQANRDVDAKPGEKRLFNAQLIKETSSFLAQQLAAIRNAKANGGDISEAIKATNALASKDAPAFGKQTNDPMLQQEQGPQVNAQRIAEQNTDPYQTPPAGHFNPINGAAVGSGIGGGQQTQASPFGGSAPFAAPNFGTNPGFGSSSNNEAMPF